MAYDREFMAQFRNQPCLICKREEGTHGEHLKTKGSGAPCIPENVWPSCNDHHREKEELGIGGMQKKYLSFSVWLKRNGWYVWKGKWLNDKVEAEISRIEKGWKW